MNGRAPPPPQDLVETVRAFMPRARRGWRIGVAAFAVGLLATTVWTLSTKRLYRSEAGILYERGILSSGNGSMSLPVDSESSRQAGIRLEDMVTSRQRLGDLINEMHLYSNIVDQRGVSEAIELMRSRMKVAVREGYTFGVSYDAENRDSAQQVLSRLIDGVIADDTARRRREADEAMQFLDKERRQADDDLKVKESALAAFLAQHPEVASETTTGTPTVGSSTRAANRSAAPETSAGIASLELQAAQIQEALAAASRTSPAVIAERGADPAVVQVKNQAAAQLDAAEHDLADKQARYTDEHPDVKSARQRVADARAALRAAQAAVAASLAAAPPSPAAAPVNTDPGAAQTAGLHRALAAVQSQIAALRAQSAPRAQTRPGVQSNVDVDTTLTRLARDVSETRERQGQLESKQFQAQLLNTLVATKQAGALVVVDPPFRPMRPVAGGRMKVGLAGGAASIVLGLFALVIGGLMDRRIYDPQDVSRAIGADVIVVVAKLLEAAPATGPPTSAEAAETGA